MPARSTVLPKTRFPSTGLISAASPLPVPLSVIPRLIVCVEPVELFSIFGALPPKSKSVSAAPFRMKLPAPLLKKMRY